MGDVEFVELGMFNDRQYWINPVDKSLHWRVPDVRETIRARPAGFVTCLDHLPTEYEPRPDLGYKVLSADYSQVEIKIMARLSGDKNLIASINSGKDVHSFNATTVFGARYNFDYELMETARKHHEHPRSNELSLIRSRVKTVSFGVPYGAGPTRVALMTGLSLEDAEAFINDFFEGFPELKKWIEDQGDSACRFRRYVDDGPMMAYSASPRNRKRFYLEPDQGPDYEKLLKQIRRWAGNMPIQAGNVDMLKPAMVMIYKDVRGGTFSGPRRYDAKFLLAVHDEAVMEVREDHVAAVRRIMENRMNEAYWNIIPRWDAEDSKNPGFNLEGEPLVRMAGGVLNKIDVVVSDMWEKA